MDKGGAGAGRAGGVVPVNNKLEAMLKVDRNLR
jgi:hypothetical protein